MDKALFGKALIRLRGQRSQKAVARRAGIPGATWCAWEKGHRAPHDRQVQKILQGLECTERDLDTALWQLQTERLKLEGSDMEDSIQAALSQHQAQITELLQTKLNQMPEEIRPLLIRLRVSLRAMGEKLADVNTDFEALIIALSQDR